MNLKNLALLLISLALAMLLVGCGGIGPSVPPTPTAAIVVVEALDADTEEPLTVDADVVVGGVRSVITVAEGSVVIRDVPFGTGTPPTQPLTVTAPGYVTFAEPIQISLTMVTFFTATLEKADPAETGTVRGTVKTPDGLPVPSALVRFTQTGPGGVTEVRGYTDDQGAYNIGGIPIGNVTVTVEADGFVTSALSTTVVQDSGGGHNPDLPVSLLPGSTRVDVTGIVFDAFTQAPLPQAQVQFGTVGTTGVNAAGEFTLTSVPVGTHQVTVTASGYDELTQDVVVLPGMARLRFGLSPSAPQPPGGPFNLAGHVTLNGRPDNAGAQVTATDLSSGQIVNAVVTPASGDYTMFLIPGDYRITASFGGRSVRTTVTVPGGGRILRGVDFVLTVQ